VAFKDGYRYGFDVWHLRMDIKGFDLWHLRMDMRCEASVEPQFSI
jgi:hypothetical protein